MMLIKMSPLRALPLDTDTLSAPAATVFGVVIPRLPSTVNSPLTAESLTISTLRTPRDAGTLSLMTQARLLKAMDSRPEPLHEAAITALPIVPSCSAGIVTV